MPDLARADELVRSMEQDPAFRAEVEAAPTMEAKRSIVDAHGFQDVGLDDMRAYVESKGGQLIVQEGGRELTEQELAAVAGGTSAEEAGMIAGGTILTVGVVVGFAAVAAG